ncbi:MAG: carboxylesterase family protein [Deltaproteobacteria bacterium]|nr:carboxylesterase family protein [Deltaproteobacteria bacterium]
MKPSLWQRCMVLVLAMMVALLITACSRDEDAGYVTDTVTVAGGQIKGATQDGVLIFKGIPYAAPPVGNLRWKPPAPVVPWAGVRNCTDWAPIAPQPYSVAMEGRGGYSEDCLYLNLVTPAKRVNERLPVMVFFHGGGLASQTGNSPTYNNTAGLPQKGVVTLTVNSRLGPIGYMAHPELTAESGYGGSGNYGTMDLVASLNWVKNNITRFGGDPNNVTIFGESGGGTKTISVITAPQGKGLFHKAIIESGDGAIARGGSAVVVQEAAGQTLFQALGVTTLAEARAKTWEEIIEAGTASSFSPTLTIDGRWLTDTVYNIFAAGEQGNFPLIVGAQSGEAMLRSTTPLIASLNSAVNPNTYIYVFSHLPPVWRDECVAFHGLELPYVFGAIPEGLATWTVLYLAPGGGCTAPSPAEMEVYGTGYDDKDPLVADYATSMWTRFAKTGNPSIPGVINWPSYTAANDTYLDIGNIAEDGDPLLKVKTGVVAAYTPPPTPPPSDNVTYTDESYGFSVTYPDNWVTGAAAATGVVWRVGSGSSFIPSVRAIVRPSTQGTTLQEVFTAHLTQDGGKTITAFTASNVTINGLAYTKADVTYTSSVGTYDSMIIGRIEGNNWFIFEVYTVPAYYRFDTATQKNDILNSVTMSAGADIADPITITGGLVSGLQQDGCRIYKGIPYAAPPVGNLRWKPPQPVVPWTGVLAATTWAPVAPQGYTDPMLERGGIDEDCLHLNIVTPAQKVNEGLPVMVFFHGGGLATHTGNSDTYNNTALPKQGVVVVTVNSRLGPLGYLAHPLLTAESGYGGSGNYGTMDMVASLNWVKNNISAFGGNPNNVTIFGESGGGQKVLSLMTSTFANGLYHKAVVQSGSMGIQPTATPQLSVSEGRGETLFTQLGVTTLAQARAKTWQEIIDAGENSGFSPSLTIDGYALTDTVYNIFDQGHQGNVPFMIGAQTRDLGTELQQNVPLTANLMSRIQPNTFVYVFSHLPPNWAAQPACAAFHGLELPYMFGYIPEGLDTAIVRLFSVTNGCNGEPGYDAGDDTVAENSVKIWAQFGKTGNPSVPGLINWPAYTQANDTYVEIANPLQVKTGVAAAYIPAPEPPPVEDVTYTNAAYGFSVTHPNDWVEGAAAAPGVIWRVGKGGNYVPSVRVIVRPVSDGATLRAVFETHLTADGNKTITEYTEAPATINGVDYTKADVAYATTNAYDSMIIGRKINGNTQWIIFEVYTAAPNYFPFASPTQKQDILNTVTWP